MTRPARSIALAATLVSTLLGLSPAEAGADGVRLNFGGPLGTFVARPTPGYGGGGSGYATAHKAQRPSTKATHQVARSAPVAKTRPSVVASKPKAEPRVAALHTPDRRKSPRSVVETGSTNKLTSTPVVETPDANDETTANLTRSALILPPAEPLSAAEPTPSTELAALEAPAAQVAETVEDATDGAKSAASDPAEEAVTTMANAGPQDCKRFIPAVGVTVSVGCEK